jgi:hypothetical protein
MIVSNTISKVDVNLDLYGAVNSFTVSGLRFGAGD